jgi:hypothetical protein
VAGLVDRLHDIHYYARQHQKVVVDQMKARYDRPANSVGFQEEDQVWLFRQTRIRGKSPKLRSSWEGPYKVITWLKDVVCRIQRHPRMKIWYAWTDG